MLQMKIQLRKILNIVFNDLLPRFKGSGHIILQPMAGMGEEKPVWCIEVVVCSAKGEYNSKATKFQRCKTMRWLKATVPVMMSVFLCWLKPLKIYH